MPLIDVDLRQYFAGRATIRAFGGGTVQDFADRAFLMADAMMLERENWPIDPGQGTAIPLRDWYAGQALTSTIEKDSMYPAQHEDWPQKYAEDAYIIADAMINHE